MEKFEMYAQLYEAECRYTRACRQIEHLNIKLEDLNKRYIKARTDDNKPFRYKLRMRIMTHDGILSSYCMYACFKKNEILDLRYKLYGENPDDGELIYDMSDDMEIE